MSNALETPEPRRKPPFIGTQRLFRLDPAIRPDARTQWINDPQRFRLLRRRQDDGSLKYDGPDVPGVEHFWDEVPDRQAFFRQAEFRRLCVTIDAGIGKTIALRQLQYLLQAADPQQLAVRVEFHELPADFNAYLGSVDGETPRLVRWLQRDIETEGVEEPWVRRQLLTLLRRKIRTGQLTLLIDALDQFNPAFRNPDDVAGALRDFLRKYPTVRCVISGRPFAIQHYADPLLSDTGTWEFVQVDVFTPDEQEGFLGKDRYDLLTQLEADVISIPRSLEMLWELKGKELSQLRTAAQVYWRSIHTMLERARKSQLPQISDEQALFLLSLLAFEMIRQGILAGVDQIDQKHPRPAGIDKDHYEEFVGDVFDRRHAEHPAFRRNFPDYDGFQDKLGALGGLNVFLDPSVLQIRSGTNPNHPELKEIYWRNRTLQDFFAALWVTRYLAAEADRNWLRAHLHLRGKYDEHYQHPELYEFWKLAAEMPAGARRDDVWPQSLSVLYLPAPKTGKTVRSTEMMYRGWRTLLHLARDEAGNRYLVDENAPERPPADPGSEPQVSVQAATARAQAEIRASIQQETIECDPQAPFPPTGAACARHVLEQFLGEFPALLAGRGDAARIAREYDEEWFVPLEAGRFWMGDAESDYGDEPLHAAEISAELQLAKFPVTNELYGLFDGLHAERFDEYSIYSGSPRCPAIYINWYDGWCAATWLHGRLPDEYEWEYACRGQRWSADVRPEERPQPTLWCFGDEESLLVGYAWYFGNSGEQTKDDKRQAQTHPVGEKRANDFGLYDMHGNVWEWTSSWYHKDPRRGRDPHYASGSRVLRGGAFLNFADFCRSAIRLDDHPAGTFDGGGFRVARA